MPILGAMEPKDLTGAYGAHFLAAGDRQSYEAVWPQLFDHYYAFWADQNRSPVIFPIEELAARRAHIMEAAGRIETACAAAGLDISSLPLVLMVGQNTSNGHAFRTDRQFAAWVAVETYTTPLLAEIFVTHEIVHALHYLHQPAFFFHSRAEQQNPLRLLITEGVASYLTMKILGCDMPLALWADFLPPTALADWMNACHIAMPALAAEFLARLGTGDPGELFVMADPTAIRRNRAGYFLGCQMVAAVAQERQATAAGILATTPQQFYNLARDYLTAVAARRTTD